MPSTFEEEYEALLQFLYIAPIGLVQIHNDGEIVMVNPLCAQLLMPLSRDGGLANLFVALEGVAPDLCHHVESFQGPSGTICDSMHLHVDIGRSGRKEAQVVSLSLLRLDPERLMGVLGDATQPVRRDRELRQSQAWIRTIVTGLTDYAMVSLDEQGRCQDWNPSIARVTGFAQNATRGSTYSMFYPPGAMSIHRVLNRLHEADSTRWSLDEGWRMRADGSRYWGSCLSAPMHEPGEPQAKERTYSLIIRDISDRREATEAMRRSLSCDHLTGLANRRVLFETAELEFQRWLRAPRPLSVVMIDADHFKRINDHYGHATGDAVLRCCGAAVLRHRATAMASAFNPMDVVARLGGEEFVALLPGTTLDAASAAAEGLCRTIESQAVTVGDQIVRYTVSAGVASMQAGVQSVDSLLHRADTAMYAAKALGRNRVVRWNDVQDRMSPAPTP